jgi:hypothetical protein
MIAAFSGGLFTSRWLSGRPGPSWQPNRESEFSAGDVRLSRSTARRRQAPARAGAQTMQIKDWMEPCRTGHQVKGTLLWPIDRRDRQAPSQLGRLFVTRVGENNLMTLALFERSKMDAVDPPRGYQAELSAGEDGDCLRSYLHCCRKLRTASPEPRAGTAIGAGSPSKTILISFCALAIMDINLTDQMNV